MKRLLNVFVFCATLVAASGAAAQQEQQEQQGPQELVESTASLVLGKLKEQRELLQKEPTRIYGLVNEYIVPHFDFERMSSWVLGKYWRRATPEQKARFTEEFKTLLVRTYASSLLEYVDQDITYLPLRGNPASGEVTVRSEIQQPGGFPIPVTYDLYKPDGAWKVYDVAIDNVSLVANYRTSFARKIRQDGLDALISQLAERNRQALP